MSRSDLLLQLVQSGGKGDMLLFKKVVQAIIAEERAKQHNSYAEKLLETLNAIDHRSPVGMQLNGKRTNPGDDHIFEIRPELSLDDLVLNTENREILNTLVEEHKRADLLRSYSFEPRNRILLIGPPGNGKTSSAEAIASALMLPLYSVRYESIIASYLGETSIRLKNLFDYVKTQQCVLFFDEFDAIGKERGDIHETGEIKRVVSSLLLNIDQLPSYVIVVAATNHSELLDRAVWRRFQIKLSLQNPKPKEIAEFVSMYQTKHDISFGITPLEFGRKLNRLNYSQIKDFCDDIMRKFILKQPASQKTMKLMVTKMLAALSK